MFNCVLQLCGRPLWVSGTIVSVKGAGGRTGSDLLKMEVEVVSELEPSLKSTLFGDDVFVVNPVRSSWVAAGVGAGLARGVLHARTPTPTPHSFPFFSVACHQYPPLPYPVLPLVSCLFAWF
jgi:hypothetical protein